MAPPLGECAPSDSRSATTWPTPWPPSGWGSIWTFPSLPSSARWPASPGCSAASRFSGAVGRITVVDDYGHHPTEIRATLAAAKAGFDCRVVVVFQPHRYTRTAHLRQDFLTAFNQADVLAVMDVYSAGEPVDSRGDRRGSGGGHRRPRPPSGDLRGQRSCSCPRSRVRDRPAGRSRADARRGRCQPDRPGVAPPAGRPSAAQGRITC